MILFHNFLRGDIMIRIIMKRVPKKIDPSLQHKVMKSWSATIVESHLPRKHIVIISSKDLLQPTEKSSDQKK